MSAASRLPSRVATHPDYGWSAEGKSPAEISSDIRQTRYRLESDLQELRAGFETKRLLVTAIASAAIAGLSLLIRTIRHRKR